METNNKIIEIYQTKDGRRPYEEWLNNLKDKVVRARIRARIDKVEVGNFGNYRFLGDGVSELKFTFGPGFRVYYALDGEKVVLLLIGGDKSSQQDDISIAKKYWFDHKERENE